MISRAAAAAGSNSAPSQSVASSWRGRWDTGRCRFSLVRRDPSAAVLISSMQPGWLRITRLAYCRECLQNAVMTTITVRDVPAEVRDELAARAARAGRSLQEHLRIELIELAARPSASDWVRDVQRRKSSSIGGLSREQILSYRDADRR